MAGNQGTRWRVVSRPDRVPTSDQRLLAHHDPAAQWRRFGSDALDLIVDELEVDYIDNGEMTATEDETGDLASEPQGIEGVIDDSTSCRPSSVESCATGTGTDGSGCASSSSTANRYGYRLVNYPDGRCYDYDCVPGCGPSKVCSFDPRGDYDDNVRTPSWQPYGHCCNRLVDKRRISPNGYWHRNSNAYNRVTGDYRKYQLRPGRCYGADAWIWRVSGCPTEYGGCGANKRTTMRCHDGWYKLAGADYPAGSEGGWIRTICMHRYGCG